MDILNQGDRKLYIEEILADENRQRREEHFKRQEVYNERQAAYIVEKLLEEFSAKTVANSRKVTSINLTKRIVNEKSSIYKKPPERFFTNIDNDMHEEIERVYADFRVNEKFKRANRILNLHRQGTTKIVPKNGQLIPVPLAPHQYDVIPDPEDPTKAQAYVLSGLDRRDFLKDYGIPSRSQNIGNSSNEKIADVDDYLGQTMRFVWWHSEFHFVTDKTGGLISDPIENPIKTLPFIDFSMEREFEYWVRAGSDVVNFALDFGKLLSDHFNIMRLQGYSQALILSPKVPDSFVVGPNHILHLKQDPDATKDPDFRFVTPTPDLSASIDSLEMFIRLFLSSQGLSTKTIAARESGESFSSGLERLLAMLEKFEASQDDMDQFRWVEGEYYELFKKWQYASANNDLIYDKFKVRGIPMDSELDVKFHEPEMIQTQSEVEDSSIKLLEAGLITRKKAIARVNGVSEEMAEELMNEIDEEMMGAKNVNKPQIDEIQGDIGNQLEGLDGGENT